MNLVYDDSIWWLVCVLYDWSMDEFFCFDYGSGNGYVVGGVGWYWCSFMVDVVQQGCLVCIMFDGVYDYVQVWINGQYLGGWFYGYSSF